MAPMPTLRSAHPLHLLLLLAAVTACASDDMKASGETPGPTSPRVEPRRVGGPLANAGPDRQVLEGQVVRLDAGSSLPGETGREVRYLWTVVPGEGGSVPLAIDDPTARRIRLVAPVLPEGQDRAEVRLRLRVDDGEARSEDEVRVEVVRGPSTAIAPVASAGPDLMVVAGDAAMIGPVPSGDTWIDPACAGEECAPPTITWTQVEGPPAAMATPSEQLECIAPCTRIETDRAMAEGAGSQAVAVVLAFRLDVISGITGLAAAPDYVRVFVSPRYQQIAPEVTLTPPGPWFTGIPENGIWGGTREPLGFRPILGDAEPVQGAWGYTFVHAPPASPALLGWAFEGRQGRLRSAPRFLLVDWRHLPAPIANAGSEPVLLVDQEPRTPDGCDRIRLTGSGRLSDPDSAGGDPCAGGRSDPILEYCWRQTHGPAALAGVPSSCGPRADRFESGSLLPGCDSDLACPDLVIPAPSGEADRILAFELRVRRRAVGDGTAGPWSIPDTVIVRGGARIVDDPPVVRLALLRPVGDGSPVPLSGWAGEGETVVVDASGSYDPEGMPLSFAIEGLGDKPLVFTTHDPCPTLGACFATVTPTVVAPTTFDFALTVAAGNTRTVCGPADSGGVCLDWHGRPIGRPMLSVDDSINEPPIPVVEDLSAAPGATVALDASGSHDPNGDPLAYAWSILVGDVVLEDADTATPSFVAPSAPAVVMLALRLSDDRGGEAQANVRVDVVEPPDARRPRP